MYMRKLPVAMRKKRSGKLLYREDAPDNQKAFA
jgi:hypothetical protein